MDMRSELEAEARAEAPVAHAVLIEPVRAVTEHVAADRVPVGVEVGEVLVAAVNGAPVTAEAAA